MRETYVVDLYGTFTVPMCADLYEAVDLLDHIKIAWQSGRLAGMHRRKFDPFVQAKMHVNITPSMFVTHDTVSRTGNKFDWTGIEVEATSESDAIRKVTAAISKFLDWYPCGKPSIRYT